MLQFRKNCHLIFLFEFPPNDAQEVTWISYDSKLVSQVALNFIFVNKKTSHQKKL